MEQQRDLLEHKNKHRFIFGSENKLFFVFMNRKLHGIMPTMKQRFHWGTKMIVVFFCVPSFLQFTINS